MNPESAKEPAEGSRLAALSPAERARYATWDAKAAEEFLKTLEGRSMEPAAQSNPELERKFLELAKEGYERKYPEDKWTSLRLNILSPDWEIERHPNTGVILNKFVRAQAAFSTPQFGDCFVTELYFLRPYDGSKYAENATLMVAQNTFFHVMRIPCSKAK